MTRPKIVIAGQEYPTSVVKEGSFEGTDLTLLSIDEDLLLLCGCGYDEPRFARSRLGRASKL